MPRIELDIPQTYENIVRPVCLELAQQLVKMMDIRESTQVLLPGPNGATMIPGTALPDGRLEDPTTFNHTDRLRLEVTESPVEDRIMSTAVHQNENLPFFYDDKIGLRMWPVYLGTELTFSFTYRASNRTLARRFRNEITARTAAMREENLHELNYHYVIPRGLRELLLHIHTLREQQGGYGEDFNAWLGKYLIDRATVLTNQIGTQEELAIAEYQACPLGVFQFIGTVEAEEEDKASGTWNVEFQYKLIFDQVIQLVADWPLMVHNQLVDARWRDSPNASGKLVDPDRRQLAPSLSRHVLNYFSNVYTSPCKKLIDGMVFPEFDEWRPDYVIPNTSTLYSTIVQIDPTAPTILYNLMEDMGGYVLDPKLMAFLIKEAPFMNRKGSSIVDLRLYIDNDPMDDGTLIVGPDLSVTTRDILSIRRNYHVRFGLVHDLFSLDTAAWERLRTGGEAAVMLINCLQFKLLGKAFNPPLLGGYVIRDQDLRTIAQRINDLKVPHRGGVEHVMLTVNDVVIVAHRSSDNAADQANPGGTSGQGSDSSSDPFTSTPDCCR